MIVDLPKCAAEEGTYLLKVTLIDEDGETTMPKTFKWSLSDDAGTIINNRKDVTGSPGNPTEVLLKGDDLKLQNAGDLGWRRFTARMTYDSTRGTDLPANGECRLYVQGMVNVPTPT